MKALQQNKEARPGVFSVHRAKLLLCQNFHKKWRRRVAISTSAAPVVSYEVRCLKCGMRDTEIIHLEKTSVNA